METADGPIPGPRLVESLVRGFGEDPGGLWGDPQRQAGVWAAHNPYDLAARLRGVAQFVSVGNGQLGPLDTNAPRQQARQIEQALQAENLAFSGRLRQFKTWSQSRRLCADTPSSWATSHGWAPSQGPSDLATWRSRREVSHSPTWRQLPARDGCRRHGGVSGRRVGNE